MVTRPRIFSTRELPAGVREQVARSGVDFSCASGSVTPKHLRDAAREYDALLVTVSERVDAEVLGQPERRARVVSTIATGTDNIDLEAAERYGVAVTRVPAEVTARATAELSLLLMLMAARRPDLAHADLAEGRWHQWSPYQWAGRELGGARLGLLGFGAIGRRMGQFAAALGMSVSYHRRSAVHDVPWAVPVTLERLLRTSDVLSIHVPLTTQTRGMVGASELALLPAGAIVVNSARGGILDEEALVAALDAGHLAAAGLDVFAREPVPVGDPLVEHPRVVSLPHIGSATHETRDAMIGSAASSCVAMLLGHPIPDEAVATAAGPAVAR